MQSRHRWKKHIKYVQSEIVCPKTKLIMNWYAPVYRSTPSEVTLIFIHHSRLCQFPSPIQICSEWSANPLSSGGCEDDSPSCLKRKLQEQYTRGSFFHSAWCQCTRHRSAISSKWSIVWVWVNSCSFMHMQELLNKQLHACNIHLGRSCYRPWPCNLNITLNATPKLNYLVS